MIKITITLLIIASTCAYPFEEKSRNGPPEESHAVPENKPLTSEAEPLPAGIPEDPTQTDPKLEGTDLKTDATFWWPYYRSYSYHWYPHYYRYYTPSVYYRYYYW